MSISTLAPPALRRGVAALAAVSVCGVTGLLGAGAARADTTGDPGAAYVRTAHLSPDTPKVDVYLTAFRGGATKLFIAGVGYGDTSSYKRMDAGQYAVSMRPAGAPKTTPAALSWTVDLHPGRSYTAAAIGEQAKLHGVVFADASRAPAAGKGSIRIVQAADQAQQMAVTADGTTVSSDLAFGSVSNYVSVPAGSVTVSMRIANKPSLNGSTTLTVDGRSAVTVLLLDKQGGGITARPLIDIAAPARTPDGAVPAGGGGTAVEFVDTGASDGVDTGLAAAATASLLVALGLGAVSTRRRRRLLA